MLFGGGMLCECCCESAVRQPNQAVAIWGANDPFFIPAGAQAYRNDVPGAEVVLLDTGHFALEEELDEIAAHINNLMATTFGAES